MYCSIMNQTLEATLPASILQHRPDTHPNRRDNHHHSHRVVIGDKNELQVIARGLLLELVFCSDVIY